jgi:hypothetical protein
MSNREHFLALPLPRVAKRLEHLNRLFKAGHHVDRD